jgi:hypothetical protein
MSLLGVDDKDSVPERRIGWVQEKPNVWRVIYLDDAASEKS